MPSQWNPSQSACGWHCCFVWPCAHDTWCDWSSQNCVAGQHQTWAMYVLFFENQEVMLESQNHTLPLYLGRPDRPVCTPCRSWKPLFFCCRAQSPTQQRGFFWGGKIAMSPSILRYLDRGISPGASIYSNILGAASAVSTTSDIIGHCHCSLFLAFHTSKCMLHLLGWLAATVDGRNPEPLKNRSMEM